MNLKQIVFRAVAALVLLPFFVYLGDWAVWSVRSSRGGGMDHATVSRFVVAPLKANKEEYYYDGTTEVLCSRSLFPQGASGACWWVRRNPVVYDR